jgi:cytochrome bd-type quinol oxidase subunit 2
VAIRKANKIPVMRYLTCCFCLLLIFLYFKTGKIISVEVNMAKEKARKGYNGPNSVIILLSTIISLAPIRSVKTVTKNRRIKKIFIITMYVFLMVIISAGKKYPNLKPKKEIIEVKRKFILPQSKTWFGILR